MLSYSLTSSWDFRLAQHSQIIHCGFISKKVSAPKKGLNKTGSFSWIQKQNFALETVVFTSFCISPFSYFLVMGGTNRRAQIQAGNGDWPSSSQGCQGQGGAQLGQTRLFSHLITVSHLCPVLALGKSWKCERPKECLHLESDRSPMNESQLVFLHTMATVLQSYRGKLKWQELKSQLLFSFNYMAD